MGRPITDVTCGRSDKLKKSCSFRGIRPAASLSKHVQRLNYLNTRLLALRTGEEWIGMAYDTHRRAHNYGLQRLYERFDNREVRVMIYNCFWRRVLVKAEPVLILIWLRQTSVAFELLGFKVSSGAKIWDCLTGRTC
ncbi:hypothetical protein SERLADRAFT_479916 [Serpula lacrymans var. lacrymans S7.9]|uniref:Uncharacterized protein n=1 Tax=Serpula lacrymans var. lacrymans (strain S7.9) TaxID=578457 RepID=F8PCJ2_SERL9|nr:uncharacterized protein SERLADRAFT_479916 [Serpula lacrymans var. lacrymans S7.9]EGO19390.1 hypothetical protein SERLADRAFT_479916 [Serpula lacrymans var. lacrymans S7.9]